MIAVSAAVTCSPVDTSASISRSLGAVAAPLPSAISRFVSPAMALTTTTTSWPCARVRATRLVTFRSRSRSATDVPPYF
jgi:hypothetical protein